MTSAKPKSAYGWYRTSVTVTFTIADGGAHHHVPLVLSPWSYTTYRGS